MELFNLFYENNLIKLLKWLMFCYKPFLFYLIGEMYLNTIVYSILLENDFNNNMIYINTFHLYGLFHINCINNKI